ncbi:MAG: cardiolipin synthase [Rikenellaceae bacterium]
MFWYLIISYFIIIAIPIITSIIYDKRDPVKSISWILVVIFLPYIGSFLYLTFGQNYRKKRLFSRKSSIDFQHTESLISKQLFQINSPNFKSDTDESSHLERDISTLLLNINKSPLFVNSKVDVLESGESWFAVLKSDLKEARSSIHIESYIIKDDVIGNEIIDIISEKAQEGVEVRVIYDAVGSWNLSRKYVNSIRKRGVDIRPFMPVVFPLFTSKANHRNHRKIIVIDGKIGYTGGMNIADKYIHGLPHLGAWRDIHLRIEGKNVYTLQRIFMADWGFVSKCRLSINSKYFPRIDEPIEGGVALQVASSGPDSDWASIMHAFFGAITKATESIYISTPYFLPNQSILTALKVAAQSGIDVKLIIPGRSDTKLVFWATRSYITELLNAGIKVFFYNKGFIHSKLIIIDGKVSSVGSANMDIRSFEDNFEVTAFIYNSQVSRELSEVFEVDLRNSRKINLRWWLHRSLLYRSYEATSRLLAPLL